jgi:hypothetical protein
VLAMHRVVSTRRLQQRQLALLPQQQQQVLVKAQVLLKPQMLQHYASLVQEQRGAAIRPAAPAYLSHTAGACHHLLAPPGPHN